MRATAASKKSRWSNPPIKDIIGESWYNAIGGYIYEDVYNFCIDSFSDSMQQPVDGYSEHQQRFWHGNTGQSDRKLFQPLRVPGEHSAIPDKPNKQDKSDKSDWQHQSVSE
jgi:hypothetical protein